MTTHYRKNQDPGLAKVRPWIERWIDDSTGVEIEAINIDILCSTKPGMKRDANLYRRASRGRQSDLHILLKFNLYLWLYMETGRRPSFERRLVYTDRNSPIERIVEISNKKNPGQKRMHTLPLGYETYEIIADLHSADTSLEVGATRPFNLLLPLLENLVKTAIWVPFPKGYRGKLFNMSQLKKVTGYRFTLSNLSDSFGGAYERTSL